jgi:hypothetical protein
MALSRPIAEQHSRRTAIKNQTNLILEGWVKCRHERPDLNIWFFLYLLAFWVMCAEWSTRHVRTLMDPIGRCLPSPEDGNTSSFRSIVFSSVFLEYRTMGKAQKSSNSRQNPLETIYLLFSCPLCDVLVTAEKHTLIIELLSSSTSFWYYYYYYYTLSLKKLSVCCCY